MSGDFVDCVSNFFVTGTFPRRANMTWVTLVPKVEEVEEIQVYRPVSVVGCIYSVITKVLANKMRKS